MASDAAVALPFRESMENITGAKAHAVRTALSRSINDSDGMSSESSGPPEIPPEEIVFNKSDRLGGGAFGSVYRGKCRGKMVAVKVPIMQEMSNEDLETFRNEVVVMRKTFHPNIVLFLGACTQPGNIMLVSEIMAGDLENLIIQEGKKMPMPSKIRLAKDAALGINWLHGITNIIHRDLKPANLLVSADHKTVKVTDFGFSTLKKQGERVRDQKGEAKGTALYMAPEVMLQKDITFKIDVYAFGLILWELATGDELFPDFEDYDEFFDAIIEDNVRPPINDIEPKSLGTLMARCWEKDPEQRPTMKEVVFRLDECLIDSVITNNEKRSEARTFWKRNFLLPQQTLFENVAWGEFFTALSKHLALKDETLATCLKFVSTGDCQELDPKERPPIAKDMTLDHFAVLHRYLGPFFGKLEGEEILRQTRDAVTKQWFHGDLEKAASEQRLANAETGTFLVRASSSTPGYPFTITSIGPAGDFRHRRVQRLSPQEGGGLATSTRNGLLKADNLVQLVEQNREALGLTNPCPRITKKTAYDGYLAEDE